MYLETRQLAYKNPFTNKVTTESFVNERRLINKYLKKKNQEKRKSYNTQGSLCVSMINKQNWITTGIFDHKDISNFKTFGKLLETYLAVC